MSKIFPNKKPTLFGEGENSIAVIDEEAVAGLTGSSEDSIGVIATPAVAGLTGSNITTVVKPSIGAPYTIENPNIGITWGQTEIIIATKAISVTSAKNFLILDVTCGIQYNTTPGSRSGRVNIRLQDLNGAIVAFTDVVDGVFGFLHLAVVEQDIPISTTQVVFTIENNTGFTDPGNRSAILFFPTIVNINDTHDGEITTPATATKQINAVDSHQGIITTPATATKQINAADSHRTRPTRIIS